MSAPGARRTPGAGEIYLDHIGWYAADVDAASAAFERLGFRLTPFAWHRNETPDGAAEPSGTGNRCAMLERGYLEFLVAAPDLDLPLARQLRAGLERYAGIHLIAFACADAEAERSRLAAAGFAPQPVVRLRRPTRTDRGEDATLAFSVVRTPPGTMPEGRIQMLRHDAPDLVWQPSRIARDNAIDALSGVLVCSDDPAEAARRFARYTGRRAARRAGGLAIRLERGEVVFVSPEGFAALLPGALLPARPFIGAALLRSRDLPRTRAFLRRRGVALAFDRDDALCVDAAAAAGAWLIVHGCGHTP